MDSELVFNLWAAYDSTARVVYAISGRAYYLSGTDQEKLALLKSLSATDHLNARRYKLPDNFRVVSADGNVENGVAFLNAVYDPSAQLFDSVFREIESSLLPVPAPEGLIGGLVEQKIPQSPLCVITVLYEDQNGQIRPLISDEDRSWVQSQLNQ